jgi:probable HAF family extracellular repeat protein
MSAHVRLRWAAAVLAPLTLLAVPATAAAAPPIPAGQRVDLGSLGGGGTYPVAINASGQVAGTSRTATGETHAFFWSNGVLTDLGTGPGSTLSLAVGLTDDGRVVAYGGTPTGGVFTWKAGVRTDVDTGDLPYPRALGIGGTGTVIGDYSTPSGPYGFLWRGGVLTDLGSLRPAVVNHAGVVVGVEPAGDGQSRVVRLDGLARTDLGTLPGTATVTDLSEQGDVVAQVATDAGGYRSYVRRAGATRWRELSGLPGATDVRVTAVNGSGVAVGTSNSGPGTLDRAVRWNSTVAKALPSLGGVYSQPYDLNERGDVAGFASTADGRTHGAVWRGSRVLAIGPAGETAGSANRLNEAGQAVGVSYPTISPDDFVGFRWTP